MTPRHHSSDHRAVVALLRLGSKRKLASYHKKRHKFPLQPILPLTRGDHLYGALHEKCKPPPPRKHPSNSWIRGGTWSVIDHRAQLHREGKLTQWSSRTLGRKIKSALQEDCKQRAADVGAKLVAHYETGDYKEAWLSIRGWYTTTAEKA